MATPPKDLRAALAEALGRLEGQRKKAAQYLLSHHRTAFALSVQELARAAAVSEATLVRLARDLGYGGYLELRAALMADARQKLAPEARFALEPAATAPSETVLRVARQEVDNINQTVADLDPVTLSKVVARLRKADPVITIGLGVSALLARLAAYSLYQVGLRAEPLVRDVLGLVEQVEGLPARAVVLAFAFPPYSRQTIAAAERAAARQLPVLAITDDPGSPLARVAEAALYARTDSVLYTNSLSGAMVVLAALATDLALADKRRALAHAEALARAGADEVIDA